MTPERRTQLEAAGIDVASALERMMGSEALLERLLGKFLDDPQYPALLAALEQGDLEGAVSAAHTLKGVCGNLSMTGLYGQFTRQVDALRAGDLSGARALMEEIGPAYEAVCRAIGGQGYEAR